MLPNVKITVRRDGIGQVEFTNDGIMGLILTGVATTSIELGVPFTVHSLAEAEDLGIQPYELPLASPAVKHGNYDAWVQVRDFYKEAGDGTKLWLVLSSENLMSTNVTAANPPCALEQLIERANGEIVAVGVTRGGEQGSTTLDGLNADVWAALAAAQQVADSYQERIMPFSVVVDGVGYMGDADTTRNLKEMSNHRVSVLLAAPQEDGIAGIGQLMGRLAAIPVQRKISRVKDGALTNLEGYLTDGEVVEFRDGALNTLHGKGFIVYRKFQGKSGYFFNGDPTATSATDDLNTISRNRIIDKVLKIAYNTYIEEVDDEVPITDEGKIEPAVCASLQEKVERQVRANTVGEVSRFDAYIDPDQNILSGAPVEVVLDITPVGYLSSIQVSLGFINPFST